MAKVINNAAYREDRTVNLDTVAPGHTVLIRGFSGGVDAYMIVRKGNTPLRIPQPKQNCIILVNITTGRIVLKGPNVECVVVSSENKLEDFHGEHKNVKLSD